MIIRDFNKLYKLYQSVLQQTFEEEIKEHGWRITRRNYRNNYSKDLTTLELFINGNGNEKEGSAYFSHAWSEVLYIDRDEKPLLIDPHIFNQDLGVAKAIRIAIEKAECLDAIFKGDKEKMHALGKLMGRFNGSVLIDRNNPSKGSLSIHYENGIEQPDSGSFIPFKNENEK